MAEVLGIISGSIAIGQALSATRLTVVKLRQLRSELHHLPDEIEELIEQIEFIGLSLEISEGALREQRLLGASPNLRQHDANHRIITRCHRVLEDLGSLADRTKDSMCSRSVKGRVKAMLQKDDLERLRARLEQAIQALTLSQSICTGLAVSKMGSRLASMDRHMTLGLTQIGDSVHSMETKMVLIESSNNENSKETPSISQATSVDAISSSHQRLQMPWVSPSRFGQIRYERKPGFFEARVVLPGWVTQFAWDLQVRRAAQGWNVWFEPFLHDPTESQIEFLIEQDRANELDYLYRRGRMNPEAGYPGSIFLSTVNAPSIDVALMFQNHFGRDIWPSLSLWSAFIKL
ncbi:hypothetical protein BS50DRAFT_109294 [Corynespora cassiicola Philippines]|uniref:Fungal N-terminal domain-containing protein n=1 Tax=Corynespora cassiicola Philippines TaxID=1448308 RepID=A0A2T2NCZ5_CORCC|nr:hypothetical protein BS50DRAFT_109294 [Corynespora cassiicola Philippines]